ncbi:MAG TPA: ribose-phosphate diphosphokinase [Actinomycetota bacterium]|nr:ribose-phosphate diphosphokinase [Actinomycetota bacterium]
MEIGVKKRAMIFSGSSNSELAEEIAAHLGMRLGEVDLTRFASGEIYVRFRESVRGVDAFVVQSHCSPVNEMIMEQLLMIDALKRASAKRISAVIPFFGYSRQDRKNLAREPISARLVMDLLSAAGVDRVLTVDLHSGQTQGFYDGPVDHLTALPILSEYVQEKYPDNLVVVAPDAGRAGHADKYARHLNAPIAVMSKSRRADVRNVSATRGLIGDVSGRRCLVVDDMIDTAGTLTSGVNELIEQGATDVIAVATHGVFSDPAMERIEKSALSEVIVTNSLPLPKEKRTDKITVLSIAPIFASTVKAVFEDESVSEIFQGEHLEGLPPERSPYQDEEDEQ